MKLIFTLFVVTAGGILAWYVGQSITPEIVLVGVAIAGGALMGIIMLIFAWGIMMFGNEDRANERENNQRPQSPPVIVIQAPPMPPQLEDIWTTKMLEEDR